jgi:hypothetical protein
MRQERKLPTITIREGDQHRRLKAIENEFSANVWYGSKCGAVKRVHLCWNLARKEQRVYGLCLAGM